jgi:hypothetical protein
LPGPVIADGLWAERRIGCLVTVAAMRGSDPTIGPCPELLATGVRPHQARTRRAESDASGAAKANRDLIAVDNDRHGAATLAVAEHPLQIGGALLDVDVFELHVPPLKILPGGLRVGSSVLAEDGDHGAIVMRPWGLTPSQRDALAEPIVGVRPRSARDGAISSDDRCCVLAKLTTAAIATFWMTISGLAGSFSSDRFLLPPDRVARRPRVYIPGAPNKKYGRTGTLWDGRYRDPIVAEERYFFTCLRYIEHNPVKARMVIRPEDYRWSSYRFHAYGEPSAWLVPHPLYLALGKTAKERQAAYRALSRLLPDADLGSDPHVGSEPQDESCEVIPAAASQLIGV